MDNPEVIAEALWRRLTDGGWSLAPVDLRAAARTLGITIITWRPADRRLLGALIRSRRTAFVNDAVSGPRQRFTAAHELGHFALNHQGDYYCYDGLRSSQEREANVFAAALLMPAPLAEMAWLKYGALPVAGRVNAIAARLAVSRIALNYRLQRLGLLAATPAPWQVTATPARVE